MSLNKIIHYPMNINLHMILLGSIIKFMVVLTSGVDSEKPITHLKKSEGNVGTTNMLIFAPKVPIAVL